MGTKELSPRTLFKKKSQQAPAGTKCHLYAQNGQEYADSYVTKWKQIHGKLGMKKGQQQIVAQLLESHYLGQDIQSKLIGTIPVGGRSQNHSKSMDHSEMHSTISQLQVKDHQQPVK